MNKKITVKITMIVIIAMILTVPSTVLQISQAQISQSDQNTILSKHNSERSAVGVQPLTWSNSLATQSQDYANQLSTGGYVCNGSSCANNIPHGASNENLAWGSPGYPVSSMVQGWANEKSAYDGQPIPSGYSPAGHYTAMVWQNTHEVGCGFVATGQIDILVCRYNPAGNIVGQMPYGNTNQAVTDNETTFVPNEGVAGGENSGVNNGGDSGGSGSGDSGGSGSGDSGGSGSGDSGGSGSGDSGGSGSGDSGGSGSGDSGGSGSGDSGGSGSGDSGGSGSEGGN